jgi:acyl-CoA reductase-like NAD-dependent aldehyde dehydrogenase
MSLPARREARDSSKKEASMVVISDKYPMVIGGERRWSSTVGQQPAVDPSIGKEFASVVSAGPTELEEAVELARKVVRGGPWSKLRADQRARFLFRVADLIERSRDDLALVDARDSGKPIRDCRYQVGEAAEYFRYYAGLCDKIGGENVPPHGEYLSFTEREPHGVVGALIPWNSPFLLAAEKVAPALAAGNAIILKPAPEASLSATLLGELCTEAEIPAGVVSVLCGGASLGADLVRSPGIDCIAFTGSVETGQKIARNAAERLVPVLLELGGKSANIVFDDADLAAAADRAMNAIFRSAGQSCVAGSRLFLHRKIAAEVTDRLKGSLKELRVGAATDQTTQMGPVISSNHLAKVMGFIDSGKQEGARIIYGGDRLQRDGYFLQPTVFDSVGDTMRIASEEIFGPVLSIFEFDDEDEVVHRANATKYGLAAAVWTSNFQRGYRVAKRLESGMVWINSFRTTSPGVPFGGRKMSGYGREHGIEGYLAYTQTKSIFVSTSTSNASWLGGTWQPDGRKITS